jgi:hypothetical protein
MADATDLDEKTRQTGWLAPLDSRTNGAPSPGDRHTCRKGARILLSRASRLGIKHNCLRSDFVPDCCPFHSIPSTSMALLVPKHTSPCSCSSSAWWHWASFVQRSLACSALAAIAASSRQLNLSPSCPHDHNLPLVPAEEERHNQDPVSLLIFGLLVKCLV